jgi:hypothetical protein
MSTWARLLNQTYTGNTRSRLAGARSSNIKNHRETTDGHERIRPFQDRHRAVEFPHRGTDGGRAPLSARCAPLEDVVSVKVEAQLYGSLALTGVGHATDKAVILGLMGETPQGVMPDSRSTTSWPRPNSGELKLLGTKHAVPFSAAPPGLPQGRRCRNTRTACASRCTCADGRYGRTVYYSVGGGFINEAGERPTVSTATDSPAATTIPYPFDTMDQLLALGEKSGLTIPQMLRANERAKHERRPAQRRYGQDLAGDARLYRPWPRHRPASCRAA